MCVLVVFWGIKLLALLVTSYCFTKFKPVTSLLLNCLVRKLVGKTVNVLYRSSRPFFPKAQAQSRLGICGNRLLQSRWESNSSTLGRGGRLKAPKSKSVLVFFLSNTIMMEAGPWRGDEKWFLKKANKIILLLAYHGGSKKLAFLLFSSFYSPDSFVG